MVFSVNIIGAGHVGKTIGHLLVKHKLAKIVAVCNRSGLSAASAINFMGQGKYCANIMELPAADITFITTPDDFISITCEELNKNYALKADSIVVHCSGSLTSDILAVVKGKGCYIASVHPMKSFAQPDLSVMEFNGTYCAIEGDKQALTSIRSLFNAMGAITYEIDKTKKSSYHAAGVFASNYLVTLAKQALSCMKEAGVENEMAMNVITHIMRGTVSNLAKTLSPEQSLTGPIQRGDISTIKNHIISLTELEQKQLYSMLGNATVHLTNHSTSEKEKITAALHI